jgi:hypothetical protein
MENIPLRELLQGLQDRPTLQPALFPQLSEVGAGEDSPKEKTTVNKEMDKDQ